MTSDVFFGLSTLLLLDISYNKLQVLPTEIFSELSNLQVLDVGWNSLVQIPNESVAPLHSLQTLALDGNYFTSYSLGKEFKKLQHLESFTIANSEPSLKQNITNETFQHLEMDQNKDTIFRLLWYPSSITTYSMGKLTNVKDLDIVMPPLDGFESVECSLQTLSISLAKLMPSIVFNTRMYNRWNASLTSLSFDSGIVPNLHYGPIYSGLPHLKKLELTNQQIQFISNDTFAGLEHLEQLILAHNKLQTVPSHALEPFKKHATLKTLDLSYNGMTGSLPKDAFAAVPFLRTLNMAGNRVNLKPDWSSVLVNLTELNLEDSYASLYFANKFPSLQNLFLGVQTLKPNFRLWPQIPLCTLARLISYLTFFNFIPCCDRIIVAKILGSECTFLQHLDMSGTFTNTKVFQEHQPEINLPKLEILLIARNEIVSITQIQFLKAPQLKELDISYNKLESIEKGNDFYLHNLISINLRGNKLTSLNGLHVLKYLNTLLAANNQITTVPNLLLNKSPQSAIKTLDLGANPFDCSCDILQFKQWMMEDNITWLVPNDLYTCGSPDKMEGQSIVNIDLDCRSKLVLYLSTSISSAILIFVIIALSIKYRWHIKYQLFLICNRRRIQNYVNIQEDINGNEEEAHIPKYDAYVVYAEDCVNDERWVINDLRPNLEEGREPFQLCIKGRDFIPGSAIVDSISESILHSHRTILVLSEAFVESEWCYFEMQMAQMRLFAENRDVLVLVMLEEILNEKLTLFLRQLLCKLDYFVWPDDRIGQSLFWKRLRAELKRPVYVNHRYNL